MNWQSPGAKFYLDWLDPVSGKRIREIAGVGPREAKDAWFRKSKFLAGEIEQDDISPEIGITSTLVIDPLAGIIYIVARTKNTSNSTDHYFLHALSLTSESEQLGGPIEITGQVNGTGTDNQGGVITFDPTYQPQRPSLLLQNGVLYIAFGSLGDIGGLWHGWVMSYNATTLQRDGIFNVTPDGADGGIWTSDQGLVGDASGNVYTMVGNGDFNANVAGGTNYGDSFLKFSGSSLNVADYFTPSNQATLNVDDIDLGADGPMLMPGTTLLGGSPKPSPACDCR